MMAFIRQLFTKFAFFYNSLKNQTQIVLLGVVVGIIGLIGIISFFSKIIQINVHRANIKLVKKEVETTEAQLKTAMTSNISTLQQRLHQQAEKQKALFAISSQIKKYQSSTISKDNFFNVLKMLLAKDSGLTLVNMNSMPEKVLLQTASETLYEYPVELTLKGNFNDIYDYFHQLKEKNFNIHWDSLNYKVENYPTAVAVVMCHIITSEIKEDAELMNLLPSDSQTTDLQPTDLQTTDIKSTDITSSVPIPSGNST